MTDPTANAWNLVADVGGTNARFGLVDCASQDLLAIRHYPVAACPEFGQALRRFLDDVAGLGVWQARPAAGCIAVAGPMAEDVIQLTNSSWRIDRMALAEQLAHDRIEIVNDFAAVGLAVTELVPEDWHQLGGNETVVDSPAVVLGPGTGLGVCTLVPAAGGYQILAGEGGHVDFAPVSEREIEVLRLLGARFGRVSIERLLSGGGMVNVYRALAQLGGESPLFDSPAEITGAALAGGSEIALQTLELFCAVLGSVAGNLVLTLGARGGVYIAGGIVPRLTGFLQQSEFRARFEAKGRFRDYLESIPVRLVSKPDLGLHGAAKQLRLSGW